MKRLVFLGLILAGFAALSVYQRFIPKPPLETKFVLPEKPQANLEIEVKNPADFAVLAQPATYRQTYQTFNNCGPATLSMILSWYGIAKSQKDLADEMRPYQNPRGDNDDKTIFPEEFAAWAEKFGLRSVHRVNGTIELLKTFAANDIPVVVKTWLRVDDDIGHFRLVRGFDERQKVIIQDDSYHGPNKRISYFDFLSMWQPFNYGYIVVFPKEKEELVLAILGQEQDEQIAWKNAAKRAEQEAELDVDNVYPWFNLVTSYYHLGEYQKATGAFEKVESQLPRRMLWYQIEPILAYQKLKNYDRVFSISDRVLSGGNRAYSELYQIRGEIYLDQGNKAAARQEFEKALFYNKNFEPAKITLETLK